MNAEKVNDELSGKVHEWLSREGYPLEYYAAHVFRSAGFDVRQGAFAPNEGGPTREIDVLSSISRSEPKTPLVRAYNVIECKWSKEKPWVVFTAQTSRKSSSAQIAQTIGSELAQAGMYLSAGDKVLQGLELFQSPREPGFAGRQALGRESDVFYNTLRSVSGAATKTASRYSAYRGKGKAPKSAVVAFPVVLIDGLLFDAFYDDKDDCLSVRRSEHSRIFWRGEGTFSISIDVVTKEGLAGFARRRADEMRVLVEHLFERSRQLHECYHGDRTVDSLNVTSASTGMAARPAFLGLLRRRERER